MLSSASSKHRGEKEHACLSSTVVRVILDVVPNFARQFSPQSRDCPPRSWLPLTKGLRHPAPLQRTAAPRNVKHEEELETFRGVLSIVYTSVSFFRGQPVYPCP